MPDKILAPFKAFSDSEMIVRDGENVVGNEAIMKHIRAAIMEKNPDACEILDVRFCFGPKATQGNLTVEEFSKEVAEAIRNGEEVSPEELFGGSKPVHIKDFLAGKKAERVND